MVGAGRSHPQRATRRLAALNSRHPKRPRDRESDEIQLARDRANGMQRVYSDPAATISRYRPTPARANFTAITSRFRTGSPNPDLFAASTLTVSLKIRTAPLPETRSW